MKMVCMFHTNFIIITLSGVVVPTNVGRLNLKNVKTVEENYNAKIVDQEPKSKCQKVLAASANWYMNLRIWGEYNSSLKV